MDVSPSFVAEHSTAAAWLLTVCGGAALSLAIMFARKFPKAFKTLDEIKNNHVKHIEDYTSPIPQMAKDTSEMKNDVKELVGYLKAKAEDGKL